MALLAYEPDTVIVDLALPRVATEDLTMQVLVNGSYHRRLPNLSATACGTRYHAQFAPTRREQLRHPLCSTCHTPLELALADKAEIDEVP